VALDQRFVEGATSVLTGTTLQAEAASRKYPRPARTAAVNSSRRVGAFASALRADVLNQRAARAAR
jgi:hypothetical protein